jgi:subtilisin family serine protease
MHHKGIGTWLRAAATDLGIALRFLSLIGGSQPVSFTVRAGLKRPALVTIATAAVTLVALSPPGSTFAAPAAGSAEAGVYMIQLSDPPLAAYTGGVSGIPATKAATGTRLDIRSGNSRAYRDYLRSRQTDVLTRVGIAKSRQVAQYDTVLNGVAAKLTAAEVAKLRRTPGVVKLWKDETLKLDTISTPRFLGLDGPDGAWDHQFGDPSHAGEGVIVGVVDGGIWPESPSFAALPEPRPDAGVIAAKWNGVCDPGQATNGDPVRCNNKLIGARWYNFGSVAIGSRDFASPRDSDGHGSHTASTAAGDYNVPAVINGVEVGRASGMAPAARVAAYKVCYGGACGGLEVAAAIDDATADGVDVINFSISGSASSITDLVETAFFHAAAAGVFVAASAGNDGPAPNTVAHDGPWNMTVAASTHDRAATKSVTLGNSATFTGVGLGPAVASAPLIDSANAGLATADPTQAELCFVGTLDPAKVSGKMVLCKRGTNARTDKSLAVQQAGGVGMVLYNPTASLSLNADFHFVPTVHLGPTEGAAIKAYIAGNPNPTAAQAASVTVTARAPAMAAFSSTGSARAGNGDILKPDITAPGVDVIAAVSPVGHNGNLYDAISGTSMSSPHVAGLAALLLSKNPTWSPMAVKSALMTTATNLDNTGQPIQRAGANATPLDYGSGHVRPAAAFDPGLVYESAPREWLQYTCGIGQHQTLADGSNACDVVGQIDPSDLNYPTIAVGDLVGKQTVTRTVTNVTDQDSVYVPQVEVPAGYSVTVTPSALSVLAHKSAKYTLEVTRTGAPIGAWSFGSLTLTDSRGHSVKSAIAVRAANVATTTEILATGARGSVVIPVRTAFTGTLVAKPFGLVQSVVTTTHLVGNDAGRFDPANPAASATVTKFTVTVPLGAKVARFSTFDADYPAGTDLDMYVYHAGTTDPVGTSIGGSAEEGVTFTAPGTYDVYVDQFRLRSGVGENDVKLHSFLVDSTTLDNLAVTPASQPITTGQTRTVTATWAGLTPGRHYLGVVEFGNGSTAVGQSVIQIAP